ncbi:hypothetical protein J31TS6_57140 [Brevibacillus reuszeri]|uniref:hypothetical protein n=1 Tax=Brevibacillus reuszeri TaxID=54915 RepID=UPI001B05BDED|nr:hypothetical protein [Brevibacillus reuszeri]GIO09686.1 hypothetical protein J31TS6_57140 [Brevibacillus reuszeri]
MTIDQIITFFMEWGWLLALLLFVVGSMAADFFPRVYAFIAHIESNYPEFGERLYTKEKDLIDRYEFLPVRIRNGFALIGGKQAWAWLVTRMYRYLRERTKTKSKE